MKDIGGNLVEKLDSNNEANRDQHLTIMGQHNEYHVEQMNKIQQLKDTVSEGKERIQVIEEKLININETITETKEITIKFNVGDWSKVINRGYREVLMLANSESPSRLPLFGGLR
jgi:hypothetical protein